MSDRHAADVACTEQTYKTTLFTNKKENNMTDL